MAYGTSTCFVGRIIFREDRLAGLDWQDYCEIPAENELTVDTVAMYFCSPHHQALLTALAEAGLVEQVAVWSPGQDPSDALEQAWGTPDLHQGE